jgi:hypothetical protein
VSTQNPSTDGPELAALATALEGVVGSFELSPSPLVAALLSMLRHVLSLVRGYLRAPDGMRLAAVAHPTSAALHLVEQGAELGPPIPPSPPAPSSPLAATAPLGPVHERFASIVAVALHELAEVETALARIHRDHYSLRSDVKDRVSLDSANEALGDARLSLHGLSESLCELGAALTGEEKKAPPLVQAVALADLLAALRPPALRNDCDRMVRESAAGAFAEP